MTQELIAVVGRYADWLDFRKRMHRDGATLRGTHEVISAKGTTYRYASSDHQTRGHRWTGVETVGNSYDLPLDMWRLYDLLQILASRSEKEPDQS